MDLKKVPALDPRQKACSLFEEFLRAPVRHTNVA
jgi:hypothetical protein